MRKGRNVAIRCVFLMICGLRGTTGINQDSGAWVLIFEGFWLLKLVFEWCRIHTKTVFAQHSPRKSRKPHKKAENNTKVLPGNPGNPYKTWENLGEPRRTWVETVGIGDFSGGPGGRPAKVSSGKSGWRVARYFDPQFLNFRRRRCRHVWPAGLPRLKV